MWDDAQVDVSWEMCWMRWDDVGIKVYNEKSVFFYAQIVTTQLFNKKQTKRSI